MIRPRLQFCWDMESEEIERMSRMSSSPASTKMDCGQCIVVRGGDPKEAERLPGCFFRRIAELRLQRDRRRRMRMIDA